MSKFKKILFQTIILSIMLVLNVRITHAETHIGVNDIKQEWYWDKVYSPYVLDEPIYIPKGYVLNIGEGVEIKSAPNDDSPNTITADGDLYVHGTDIDPVIFNNLYSLYLSNNKFNIDGAVFDVTGLDITKSTGTIKSSTIKNAFYAITAKGSNLDISSTTFERNSYGIVSNINRSIFQANNKNGYDIENIGGEGNAMLGINNLIVDDLQNVIKISDSNIINSSYYGILNQTVNTIDAKNNWWGRKEGPNPSETFGLVDVEPWRLRDPKIVDREVLCCSNILFLPGFEASRLYKEEKSFLGTSTNTLWEPNRNDDVRKLYMDKDGKSLDSTIYTKDIIDVALGIKSIYKTFIDSMDDLVKEKTICRWMPIAYDWRNSIYDVVDDSIVDKVIDLAKDSSTGKIVIVAHSNGGLFAKQLMEKLESLGKGYIVEKIINVAVPELGTPEAILSMLHGHNQSMGMGMIMNENNARTFSQNLPGAYGLLPTNQFFEKNPITVISDLFNKKTLVSTFNDMKNFLLNNPFSIASSTNTDIPLLLNPSLFSKSNTFHNSIDKWKPASSTKVISIFGWGNSTSKGIEYHKDPHCIDKTKDCSPVYSTKLTESGDGTVITDSNSGNADSTMYFNLNMLNKDNLSNINHANILESKQLQSKIIDTVKGDINTNTKPDYDKYFSDTVPIDTNKYVDIKIFSPVDIDVYDKNGRHTGLIYNSKIGRNIIDEDYNIPGGYYADFSGNKYVRLPYGDDYQIVLSGNDTGTFIVQTDIVQYDNVIASTTFSELPVTPLMNIDFVIGTSTESFASSTAMYIDIDGDGETDLVGRPDIYLHSTTTSPVKDISTYLEFMRKTILSLKLPSSMEKMWVNRIDKISKSPKNQSMKRVEFIKKRLSSKRYKSRKLNDSQRTAIINTFNGLLEYLENRRDD